MSRRRGKRKGLLMTKTIPMLRQMKLTERQFFALDNPIDDSLTKPDVPNSLGKRVKGEIDLGHHREIGKFSTLLTADLYRREDMFVEDDLTRPEWHASIAYMQGKRPSGERVLSSFSAWPDEVKNEAIQMCKNMMKGRGQGECIWLGKPSSIHLFRALTDDEITILPYMPQYMVGVPQDTEC